MQRELGYSDLGLEGNLRRVRVRIQKDPKGSKDIQKIPVGGHKDTSRIPCGYQKIPLGYH